MLSSFSAYNGGRVMISSRFSPCIMSRFVETLSIKVGKDTYRGVLSKSDLSHDWRKPGFFLTMDTSQAAEAYAKMQSAL